MTSSVPFASAGFIASTRQPLATLWRLAGLEGGKGRKATTDGLFLTQIMVFISFFLLIVCFDMLDILLQPLDEF